ncbi:MAG TPA: ATP-binding protein [Segeticoccus sp.]|uniref:sensor histidine kinase n=1 Tax=Segeticoccus sp. TaxID=2706531 RepID=UPI002D80B702|nr:ATP-binding protein [Segeticoccus sp.]HET8600704.1 ATP-binding protein [Segeticoccus sp.]
MSAGDHAQDTAASAALNGTSPGHLAADGVPASDGELRRWAGVIARSAPDGCVVASGDGTVLQVNPRAERILGTAGRGLVGSDIRDSLPLQDPEGRSWWDCTNPWGGLRTRTGHRERLLLMPDGNEVLVSARYVRRHRSGPLAALVLALRDAGTRRRIEASNAMLISTVAHELRSPLTSVKGFSSTLLRRWERFSDEQKRWMIETIETDADRVTRLITELLDISRIDSGRLTVHKQPVDLVKAARGQIERMVASGHDEDRFELVHDQELPEIWADPDRIEQILANLLENAIRHGEGCVRVGLEPVSEPHPAALVTISDEGTGIAPENYSLVFGRFWQGERRGGTGLGLYVVRGLVEAHGGTIAVGRGPQGGAEFRFTLPAGVPEGLL